MRGMIGCKATDVVAKDLAELCRIRNRVQDAVAAVLAEHGVAGTLVVECIPAPPVMAALPRLRDQRAAPPSP